MTAPLLRLRVLLTQAAHWHSGWLSGKLTQARAQAGNRDHDLRNKRSTQLSSSQVQVEVAPRDLAVIMILVHDTSA